VARLGRTWPMAAAQLVVGCALLIGIWVLLPARVWPIDVVGSVLGALQLGAAAALLRGAAWGRRLALIAGWATLVLGVALVTALAFTVAGLSGTYGPVGAGGALLMGVIAALVLPYVVLLPALQLAWLRARE